MDGWMDGWMGGIDSAEMFNNYMMHVSETPLNGVEISKSVQDSFKLPTKVLVWDRLLFGWRPAPLFAAWMFLRGIEIAKLSRYDLSSFFAWDRVRLNLPSSEGYDHVYPVLPRVAKLRKDGDQACEEVAFMDDNRITLGPTCDVTHLATRKIAAGIQALGEQEAAQKRRHIGQRNGAWAGKVVYTDLGLDRKFVSKKKWDKAREGVQWLIKRKDKVVPYKKILSWTGFLVHISLTYDWLRPYLKGLYLTANSWRPHRDKDGWPIKMKERSSGDEVEVQEKIEEWLDDQVRRAEGSFETGPSQKLIAASHERQDDCPSGVVWGVTRLGCDLMAMWTFLLHSKPIMIVLRPVSGHYSMVYGFVDAFGEGFGGSTRYKDRSFRLILASARIGFWCSKISERSSNYQELRNLK
jgi:hypothetical protein